jgi:hypothetical protein
MRRAWTLPGMADAGDVTEDRGFKALFTSYPVETIEVFVPELLAERGRPQTVEPIQQELPLPDLGEPSRFLDVALLATWTDGAQAVVLLIEHWSDVRRVDLLRVLWYYAALRLRHAQAEVFPVVMVTEAGLAEVPGRLESTVAGISVLAFQVRVVRIGATDLPRLRSLQNRVAALFLALAIQDAVEAAVAAVSAMARAPGPVDDIRRFLPLAVKLAKMKEEDEPRFRRRLTEEPDMVNVLDEYCEKWLAQGVAQGVAEGVAQGVAQGVTQGVVDTLRDLVANGTLSIDLARQEIERLISKGVISETVGREAIQRLG